MKLYNGGSEESLRCSENKVLSAKNSIIKNMAELEALLKKLPTFDLASKQSHISKSQNNQISSFSLESQKPETRIPSYRRSLALSLIEKDFDNFLTMLNKSKIL